MSNNRKNSDRVHDAKLTDQEVRIINYFRHNNASEVQSDFLSLFTLIAFNFPEGGEWNSYQAKFYGVWDFINAIEPLDALRRDELANDPEKLHI